MPHEQMTIVARDGNCPSHVFTPAADGQTCPAVIFFMDAGGIRPAVLEMAERLANAGYVVLLPDLFYRYGPYGPFNPKEVFKGDVRAILGPLMATTGNAKAADDTEAFLSYLDTRPDVSGRAGAVGFCMGGGMAIAAAGTWPDRFAAVASFHGGNLATDATDSPHTYAPRLKAELYIAAADADRSYPPSMAKQLETALDQAGVRYRSETYIGAAHGWMKPDFPVYDATAAERGWREMLAFFERTLKQSLR